MSSYEANQLDLSIGDSYLRIFCVNKFFTKFVVSIFLLIYEIFVCNHFVRFQILDYCCNHSVVELTNTIIQTCIIVDETLWRKQMTSVRGLHDNKSIFDYGLIGGYALVQGTK